MRAFGLICIGLALASTAAEARARPTTPAAIVEGAFAASDNQLDYAKAKLSFDHIIDPSVRESTVMAEIDKLAKTAIELAGPDADFRAKITAVRKVIYERGPWNGNRPFQYDFADPRGQKIQNTLLSTYLSTRRGNCTSMPELFLIVADRAGVQGIALADAPSHLFLRYTDFTGKAFNIEATNGGHVTRDAWYRRMLPMSDEAVQSGVYMRSLNRREAVAEMASSILDYLIDTGRYNEAVTVSETILKNYPHDVYALVKQGSAYAGLIRTEFETKYRSYELIPPNLLSRYELLTKNNKAAFDMAEVLGWRESEYSDAVAATSQIDAVNRSAKVGAGAP